MATKNMKKARYAKKALENAGFEVLYSNRFFNEFVVKLAPRHKKCEQSIERQRIYRRL